MPNLPWVHFLHSILFAFLLVAAHSTAADTNVNLGADAQAQIGQFFSKPNDASTSTEASGHTNNWAVLVCASRYWFNYRHMANALGMYRTVKRLGIPDSNIILMLADDAACNARNPFPGCVYPDRGRHLDLYGDNIEVDYRGYEVTVENFLRVLTGRVDPSLPRSKRLLTDDRSNIFVFMTGHGGDEFLKFQDNEEISAFDIADAFAQMHAKRRYHELLFMIDTCQANTMYSRFYSPGIVATGSSELHENSYSYESDIDIGVAVIDSYTHYILAYMEGINKTSRTSLQDLFDSYDPAIIRSHPGVRTDLFGRPLRSALITDFLGGVAQAEVLPPVPLSPVPPVPPVPPISPPNESPASESTAEQEVEGARAGGAFELAEEVERLEVVRDGRRGRRWAGGKAGAWGAVGVLGALGGWVGMRCRKGL